MKALKAFGALLLVMAFAAQAEAVSQGEVDGALTEYDRYKGKVVKDLQHLDTLRAQRSRAYTDLLPLFKEVAQADQEAYELYHDQMLIEMMSGRPHALSRLLFTLHVALEQLARMLAYEITYQGDQEWPFVLRLRAKAEEMFRLADQELAAMKAAVRMQ